jgi:hypothetical protein
MSDSKDGTRYNPPEKTEMPKYEFQELDNRTYSVSCDKEPQEPKKTAQLTSLSRLCF